MDRVTFKFLFGVHVPRPTTPCPEASLRRRLKARSYAITKVGFYYDRQTMRWWGRIEGDIVPFFLTERETTIPNVRRTK